ncbi:MAG: hypothetical protein B7Z15_05700 [Rhizobiales bacterium 32-66-8]|nr:MAG: hypothetical protein B7Z15_05700 [Rhizobiales bacterium 32-66-8]
MNKDAPTPLVLVSAERLCHLRWQDGELEQQWLFTERKGAFFRPRRTWRVVTEGSPATAGSLEVAKD